MSQDQTDLSAPDGKPNYPLEAMRGRQGSGQSRARRRDSPPERNKEAEKQLLGTLILNPGSVSEVDGVVQEDDFSTSLHRATYETIHHLFGEGVNVDLQSVTEGVQRRHGDELPDDAPFTLTDYTTMVGASTNAKHWATLVRESSIRYRLWQLGQWLTGKTKDSAQDVLDLHSKLLDGTYRLTDKIHPDRLADGSVLFDETVGEITAAMENEDGITGIATGYTGLDDLTGGPKRGDYLILAARPSMGKTALMLSMARNMVMGPYQGRHGPYNCAIFSAEMGRKQLATRLLSGQAKVNVHAMRKGTDERQHTSTRKLESAAEKLADAPLWIDDAPNPSVSHVRARSHELEAQHGLDVVFVDYLQLLTPPDRSVNREQQISMISSQINALAQDLDCLVVALSQLNRAVEKGQGDNKPQLKHLRESGSLEQDADHVWFIYRPEAYGVVVDDHGNSTEGIAEILARKQRNGPVGNTDLAFVKEYGRFENLADRQAATGGEDAPF